MAILRGWIGDRGGGRASSPPVVCGGPESAEPGVVPPPFATADGIEAGYAALGARVWRRCYTAFRSPLGRHVAGFGPAGSCDQHLAARTVESVTYSVAQDARLVPRQGEY